MHMAYVQAVTSIVMHIIHGFSASADGAAALSSSSFGEVRPLLPPLTSMLPKKVPAAFSAEISPARAGLPTPWAETAL